MKKKVIIVAHAMRLGGVETSLIGLLQTFDYTEYEIDLFLYSRYGEFLKYIPKEVNLLPEKKHYSSFLKEFSQNSFWMKCFKLLAKLYTKIFILINNIQGENFVYLLSIHRLSHWFLPKINSKNYDLGISFLTPHFTLAKKIKAEKKIAWVHTDYSKHELDIKNELKMWKHFDYIAAISQDSANTFIEKMPLLKDKLLVIENILPCTFVYSRSQKYEVKYNTNMTNLCTVGRFSFQKNFDSIPKITRYLLDRGLNVTWYLIGYGTDEDLIKSKIKQFDVEKNVIVLGKKLNPYPYIKACDIYIQPSRYEGKAVTVREAQMLAKPVVITHYSSATSQLEDGVDGVILPMDTFEFSRCLFTFIKNKDLQMHLSKNCKTRDFSNQSEIQKIYQLV